MLLADVGGSNRLVCARLRVSARAVRAAGRAAVRAAVQAAVRAAVRAPCARKRRGRGMRAAPLAKVSCSPKSKMTARRPSRPAGPGSAHASPSRRQSGRRGGSCSPSVAHAGRGGANSVMLQPCPTPAQNSLPEPARTRIVTNERDHHRRFTCRIFARRTDARGAGDRRVGRLEPHPRHRG